MIQTVLLSIKLAFLGFSGALIEALF
jgi:hypothetical protein